MWFWGGGHGAYKYNDVELYHVAEDRWERATPKDDWTKFKGTDSIGGGADSGHVTPQGRPFTHHSYQRVCWVPGRKAFFAVIGTGTWEFEPGKNEWRPLAGMHAGKLAGKAGPLVPVKYEQCHPSIKKRHIVTAYRTRDGREIVPVGEPWKVRAWAPGKWKTADGKPVTDVGTVSPTGSGVSNTLTVYDPELKTVLCLVNGRKIWRFDFEKMRWSEYMSLGKELRYGNNFSAYVPEQRCHVISSGEKGWWRFYPAAKKLEEIAGVPKELIGCESLTYDTTNRVVLAMGGPAPRSLWSLDPATGKFARLAPKGAVPKMSGSAGRWATLWYDPDHNACLFLLQPGQGGLEGAPCETWAYRYKRAKK